MEKRGRKATGKNKQTAITWESQEQYTEARDAAAREVEPLAFFCRKAAVKRAREISESKK
jgi:hypothetical protein